jgi:hypothetical protein
MSLIPAGTEVSYSVTYLEMTMRPDWAMPRLPGHIRLERAIDPPVWYFLSLYDAVGRDTNGRTASIRLKTTLPRCRPSCATRMW